MHAPLQTTQPGQPLWRKYRAKAALQAAAAGGPRFVWDRRLPVRVVQDHPVYAGMIEAMDDAVGVVLGTLAALRLSEKTVVVYTSDNGGVSSGDAFATGNLPLRGGKGREMWEGGTRVPFYIKAPGVAAAGSESPGRCSHSDPALYISLAILHTKHTGRRQNDFNIHA